jgi:hypothetical protein
MECSGVSSDELRVKKEIRPIDVRRHSAVTLKTCPNTVRYGILLRNFLHFVPESLAYYKYGQPNQLNWRIGGWNPILLIRHFYRTIILSYDPRAFN